MKKSLKTIQQLSFFCFLVCVAMLFSQCTHTGTKNTELKKVVEEANKDLPMQLDAFVTLAHVELTSDTSVQYSYLMDGAYELMFSPLNAEQLKKAKISELLKEDNLNVFRNAQATIVHKYINNEEEVIMECVITPDDYIHVEVGPANIFEKLKEYVAVESHDLPSELSQNLTIIGMEAEEPNLLHSYYEIKNSSQESLLKQEKTLKSNSINELKKNGDLEQFRLLGVVFTDIYLDEMGMELLRIVIQPSDYK